MELIEELTQERASILATAHETLRAVPGTHYDDVPDAELHERLATLFDYVTGAIAHRDAGGVVSYATLLAGARHDRGYRLVDVQTAFNSLEQAVWRAVVARRPATTVADDLALVTASFGLAKDELARAYVALAAEGVPPLDVAKLMTGSGAY